MNTEQPSYRHLMSELKGASVALAIVLIARFLLELALLTGTAVLAWNLVPELWHWPAAGLTIIAVATLWGLLLSPKATIKPPWLAALGIEAVLFVGTGAGLIAIGIGVPAVIGVAVWIVDRVTLALLRNHPSQSVDAVEAVTSRSSVPGGVSRTSSPQPCSDTARRVKRRD